MKNPLTSFFAFIKASTWGGIRSIFRKEIIQLLRDPFLVAFIITLPIAQLVITGLAISRDLSHVPTIVCNYDHHNDATELLKAFDNSVFFNIDKKYMVDSEDKVFESIRRGKYRIGLIIPPDYSENLLSGDSAEVRIVVDGSHATIAKTVQSTAMAVVQNHNREHQAHTALVSEFLGILDTGSVGGGMLSAIVPKSKVLFNPEFQVAYFLVPGILAIIMHMMTILFTSFAIVRERETGTLEQLMVTPIRVSDLMVGKVIPYAVIGFVDMLLTLAVMVWFFNISISGSFWFLCLASIIFIITSLAIGLLISTTCRSQVQAVQLTLGFLLPSLLLTGFVFPLEPMPWFVKIISYTLPLTYYLDIIRGVVIKGIGISELWWPMVVLIGLSFILMSACVLRFKKQIA